MTEIEKIIIFFPESYPRGCKFLIKAKNTKYLMLVYL
jgi:hypothetical protein